MKIRLLSVGKTDVFLHPATLIMAGYMALCGKMALFLVAMASIILHESAHAVAAKAMGECPLSIEITPLGTLMRLEDEAKWPPLRRFIMLLAGPAMTFALCMLALWGAAGGMIPMTLGRMLFMANMGLLLVNLLPCLPLDGGRILYLLLELWTGAAISRRMMRIVGIIMGCGMVLMSLWGSWQTGTAQFTLAACGCVVLYASHTSTTTAAMAELRQWMERKIRLEQRGIMRVKRLAVMENMPLQRVISRLPQHAWTEISLLESGTLRTMGIFNETELINAYLVFPGESCIILAEQVRNASRA